MGAYEDMVIAKIATKLHREEMEAKVKEQMVSKTYPGKINKRTILKIKPSDEEGCLVLLCLSIETGRFEVWLWNWKEDRAEWSHSYGTNLNDKDMLMDFELHQGE